MEFAALIGRETKRYKFFPNIQPIPNLELQTGSVCTDDFDSPYLGWLFHLMSSSGEIGHPYFFVPPPQLRLPGKVFRLSRYI